MKRLNAFLLRTIILEQQRCVGFFIWLWCSYKFQHSFMGKNRSVFVSDHKHLFYIYMYIYTPYCCVSPPHSFGSTLSCSSLLLFCRSLFGPLFASSPPLCRWPPSHLLPLSFPSLSCRSHDLLSSPPLCPSNPQQYLMSAFTS